MRERQDREMSPDFESTFPPASSSLAVSCLPLGWSSLVLKLRLWNALDTWVTAPHSTARPSGLKNIQSPRGYTARCGINRTCAPP